MIVYRNIEAVKDNHMSVLLLSKGFLHFLEGKRSIFIFSEGPITTNTNERVLLMFWKFN